MSRRACLLLLLAAAGAGAEEAAPLLHLADGRVLYGRRVERGAERAVLQTDFGVLVVPRAALAGATTARPEPPAPAERTTRTRWLEIRHDLAEERARLYADQLDAFFDWMIGVYRLDPDRTRRDAPYQMRVFRRRADFKELQREIAPGIEAKGRAFAEGVAGFYSPGHGAIFLWDAEGRHGGVHLEVAKHETTHLLNHLLSKQTGIKVPTWFEEGAATYFSASVALGGGAAEPEDHPGALAQVLGDLDADEPMACRALRGVKWESFLGREYSWGWALVRFLRRHRGGRAWPALLEHLRTISPLGPVTDSEERRFLEATGFSTSKAFDEAWHEHLRASRGGGDRPLVGTSPEVLARVAAIEEPTPAQARNFARIGLSLARVREPGPAIVYLRAALRGGADDPEIPYRLAGALALDGGRADDEPWPAEAVDALHRAVAGAPLRAAYRAALGRQLLLGGEVEKAFTMNGLALVLVGPADDDLHVALDLLRAAAAYWPGRPLEETLAALSDAVPPATGALRAAHLHLLQEGEDWEALAALLARRVEAGTATIEERGMLAGLYEASDRLAEAERIYAALLEEGALRYWPDRVECLARMGRKAEAKVARARALDALRDAPRDLGWVRRRLERIRID